MSRVHWDNENDTAYIKEKLDNGQTITLMFQEIDWNDDTVYFNVCLSLYSKRTQMAENERTVKTTGKNTFLNTLIWTKKAFAELERWTLSHFSYVDIVIYVGWADRRRRDIYHHYLSKNGYIYGRDLDGAKILYKKIEKGIDNYEV